MTLEPVAAEAGRDFIRDIVQADLDAKRHSLIVTRFPPEPNGYLHIGHAKSIALNFGIAQEFAGRCHLRFDDTNPTREEQEYIEFNSGRCEVARLRLGQAPVLCLGLFRAALRVGGRPDPTPASAYVDDQSQEEIRHRARHADRARQEQSVSRAPGGRKSRPVSPHEGGRISERRPRAARQDRYGFRQHQLARSRALSHPARAHPRTGDKWSIYPSYDFAHGQSDAIEGITHSICTLEFEDHRPLYDWLLDKLPVPSKPHQYEFARLNLSYTLLSKRVLTELVRGGHVAGWDDPRMPTIAGLKRRGVPPAAIREFVKRIGVAKANSVVDVGMLEFCIREILNKTAQRRMAVCGRSRS